MPMIRVEMFAGRTPEMKRALAQELTDAFTRVTGVSADSVSLVFTDVDKGDWAQAGRLYSDPASD
ncbi:tautomerase family protein [Roseovarius aestuarii]|nr:tautomerase family protein [Roseovarius aestuarii]